MSQDKDSLSEEDILSKRWSKPSPSFSLLSLHKSKRKEKKKISLLHRNRAAWNGLTDETMCVKTIHKSNQDLDKSKNRDRIAYTSFFLFLYFTTI